MLREIFPDSPSRYVIIEVGDVVMVGLVTGAVVIRTKLRLMKHLKNETT